MPEFWPEDLDPTVLAMCGHVQYAHLDAAVDTLTEALRRLDEPLIYDLMVAELGHPGERPVR
jgi:hypothetical protein